jgi:GNAT superfamily N-acetyltransferase
LALPLVQAQSLQSELLESDAAYFDAAAMLEPIEGAVLSRLPGLEHLCAGAVVHRIEPGAIRLGAESWVASVEALSRTRQVQRVRMYLHRAEPKIERALRARKYAERREVGLVRTTSLAASDDHPFSKVYLEEVVDLSGWDEKRRVHESSDVSADGHPSDPRSWCEMEQRKSAHGYMRPFLIYHEASVCGTLCLASRGSLLRLKNLVIHPDWRGRGIATAAVRAAVQVAWRAGYESVGCFAIPGGPALTVYQQAGFHPIVTQTEWLQPV